MNSESILESKERNNLFVIETHTIVSMHNTISSPEKQKLTLNNNQQKKTEKYETKHRIRNRKI